MTLAELIRLRKEQLGLSFRQLGQRAKDAGAAVEPNWSHLANRELTEFPKTKTIHALAAALEVDVDEVVDAVLESIGLRTHRVPPLAPRGDGWIVVFANDLSAEDQEALRAKITGASPDAPPRRRSG